MIGRDEGVREFVDYMQEKGMQMSQQVKFMVGYNDLPINSRARGQYNGMALPAATPQQVAELRVRLQSEVPRSDDSFAPEVMPFSPHSMLPDKLKGYSNTAVVTIHADNQKVAKRIGESSFRAIAKETPLDFIVIQEGNI